MFFLGWSFAYIKEFGENFVLQEVIFTFHQPGHQLGARNDKDFLLGYYLAGTSTLYSTLYWVLFWENMYETRVEIIDFNIFNNFNIISSHI